MAVLDTTVLIDLLRNPSSEVHLRARDKTADLVVRGQAITTTRLNVAELFVGVNLASDPTTEAQRVEGLLTRFVVLEMDDRAARQFGNIAAGLRRKGLPSGDLDVLIAAIAMVHGQTLVTRNTKHFSEIDGLTVETY